MSSGAEQTRAAAATEPARRGPLVEFTGRLVREKPLGALGGVVVLVFLSPGFSHRSWPLTGSMSRIRPTG